MKRNIILHSIKKIYLVNDPSCSCNNMKNLYKFQEEIIKKIQTHFEGQDKFFGLKNHHNDKQLTL
jgi:hypothetical protein